MTMGKGLYGLPEPEKPVKPPSRLRWVIRIPLIFAIVIGASLMTLNLIGGKSDTMKLRLESYLNDTTGMESRIGTLNGIHFFPETGFDVEDVTLESEDGIKLSARNMRIYIPFWNISMRQSEFRDIHIENMIVEPGILAPRRIEIDRLAIDRDKSGSPILILDGRYGGEPVSLRAAMKSRPTGRPGASLYSLADKSAVEIHAGPMIARGVLTPSRNGKAEILFDEISAGPGFNSLKGELILSRLITGTVQSGSSKGEFSLDIERDKALLRARGSATSEQFDLADLYGDKGLVPAWQAMRTFYLGRDEAAREFAAPPDFSNIDLEVETKIHTLRDGRKDSKIPAKENLSGLIIIRNGRLSTEGFTTR